MKDKTLYLDISDQYPAYMTVVEIFAYAIL